MNRREVLQFFAPAVGLTALTLVVALGISGAATAVRTAVADSTNAKMRGDYMQDHPNPAEVKRIQATETLRPSDGPPKVST